MAAEVADAPAISVCIANYNGAACLRECIDSVLAQVDAPRYEIIVHDDASCDGSAAIAAAMPGVLLLRGEANAGYCISNNRMAAVARGRWLLLLNNDAMLYPEALRTLFAAALADASDPVLSLPQYDYASGALLDRGMRIDPFANPIPVMADAAGELAMVMGSCLWISRSSWDAIGGFPEWFGSIAEDMYLCCAARLAGQRVRVCAESGYRHVVGASFGGGKPGARGLSTTFARRCSSERNKTFVMIIACPALLLPLLLPLHLLLLLAEGVALALARADPAIFARIYLRAVLAPLPAAPVLWRARRKVQARRRASWRSFAGAVQWTCWKLVLLLRHGVPEIR